MLPKLLKGFMVGLLGALAAMIPYLLIAAAIVVGLIALKKAFDFLKENIDTVKEKLSNFADAVMAIPEKISNFFTDIFGRIKNFFIDAINGVIGLLNKIPGVEIEKIEKATVGDTETPGEQDAAFTAGNLAQGTDVENNESGLIVPSTGDEGPGVIDKVKGFFSKFNPFGKSDIEPASATGTASSNAIIDNSVKTVNQNNQSQTMGITTRNDDSTYNRFSMYYN
jgi:phage-related protein